MSTAFYCVANDEYFLGTVGLINSLRLVGHDEPIYVLDCGLAPAHRELLAAEAEIVPGPGNGAPHVLKAIAPLRHPAETIVLIDTDMIAARQLGPLIEMASGGRVVAGETGMDRFFPEWSELAGIEAVEQRPYISTGLVVLDGRLGREVLEIVDRNRDRVDFELTFWRRNVAGYPLLHADQDLINAALAARAGVEQIVVFEHRMSPSPPFDGLHVLDERTLRCGYDDGTEPFVLHHWLAKPWIEETHEGVYSQLLRRLLVDDDVRIQVPAEEVPLRLRRGVRAFAERKRIDRAERRKGGGG